MTPSIVLLTDFGLADPFVGIVKGVILERSPGVSIVDLTHGIEPQNVRQAAFALMESARFFAAGALFVCVVDPGVGSHRRILWARSERHWFLAPDNGLLSWVERREPFLEVREVSNESLFLDPVSGTFHGRDIFAPVAAALAGGLGPGRLGPELHDWERLPFPEAKRERTRVRGEILAFDRFGNAITNLRPDDLPEGSRLRCRGADLGPLRTHYAEVSPGERLAVVGSSGWIELSVREGSFRGEIEAAAGDPVDAVPAPVSGARRRAALHGR